MSDWFGSRSTAPKVNAGLDLEMPGPPRDRDDKLVAAVHAGEVSSETVRTRARNMLRLMARVGSLDDHRAHQEHAIDLPEHPALIRRAGAAGAVLLQNDGILPLLKGGTIAVIGPNARVAQIMGGGSAQLCPHYRVSPWQGLVNAVGETALSFAPGCTNRLFEPLLTGTITVEVFKGQALQGEVVAVETMEDGTAFWFPPIGGGRLILGCFRPGSAEFSRPRPAECIGPGSLRPAMPRSLSMATLQQTPGTTGKRGIASLRKAVRRGWARSCRRQAAPAGS